MSVKIRLARGGAKKKPFYRIVAATVESPRDGKFLETLGTYNPMVEPAAITLKNERIKYWLGVGAQPTTTVKSILKREGLNSNPA
ncbi:MAG: 30S ribosomal protein S16 [Desulfamplus sp.]|nr:30S ribosomal protein S16 [Desulfamplus sp.]MBF0242238.1 30S ribosomal protein S16 [Desulfamplus sp.]MBF0390304.1 30S ribosomal protein S16 [Desulfamplus sp.]